MSESVKFKFNVKLSNKLILQHTGSKEILKESEEGEASETAGSGNNKFQLKTQHTVSLTQLGNFQNL